MADPGGACCAIGNRHRRTPGIQWGSVDPGGVGGHRKRGEAMLNNISRWRLIGMWFAAVAVVFACSVIAGAPMTTGAAELWLVGCLVPPVVTLLVWRGAPPETVAELLYAVNRPLDEGRP